MSAASTADARNRHASFEHVLPEDVAQADLLALIAQLNRDPAVARHSRTIAAAEIAAYRNHHHAIDPAIGCRRAASEQCRTPRRRLWLRWSPCSRSAASIWTKERACSLEA